MLDQQFALRWVQRNISHFGGDPGNVTLFGESAGGLSVHAQLASPTARGLFQRAIVESGGYSGSQPSLQEAEAAGSTFAARVGCGTQNAACLRDVPVATLLANEPFFEATPVIDGTVLTRSITEAFTSGRFNRVPVIEGSNHDEFRFFLAQNELAGAPAVDRIRATGRDRRDARASPARPPRTVAAEYPLRSYTSPSVALGAAVTDAAYACKARAAVQALSRYVPTYQYEFDDEASPRSFPGRPVGFPLGAFHTAELEYLFGLGGFPSQLAGDHEDAVRGDARPVDDLRENRATPAPAGRRYSATTEETESLSPPEPTIETSFAADHKCAFWSRMPAPGP